ncbi:PilW family protein [Ramlibacter sp. PS4R-6]|uniref:PilW family protein n=1 Tax=Ramlibacter sp. PS4R-6 TaxID=3133438 RepID=UPI00309EA787
MGTRLPTLATRGRRAMRGLTLIEFMIAIVLGMILVAAIATLIANQSANRAELDRAGKMLENGRYAVQTMAEDLMMAGYWGELSAAPGTATAMPDPCSTTIAGAGNLQEGTALHVQGYNAPVTLPTNLAVCVKNHKPGTDILVVRHVDPDTSAVEKTSGCTAPYSPCVDWSKLKVGQVYLQTGLNSSGTALGWALATADGSTDSTTFAKVRKDKTTGATPRKLVVHIYYIAKCSVEVSNSCTDGDNGNPIPTLKRVDLGVTSNAPAMQSPITIAEGIENMQFDFNRYTDTDKPAAADVDGSALTFANWADVKSMKIYLVARGTEKAPGFTDTKTYVMGTAGAASAPSGDEGYRRHLFIQSIRLINPSGRGT